MIKISIKLFGILALLILVGAGCARKTQPPARNNVGISVAPRITEQVNDNANSRSVSKAVVTSKAPDDSLPYHENKNEYGIGDSFGTVTVTGYARIEKDVPDCGEAGCNNASELKNAPKVDLISFIITNSNNEIFNRDIKINTGNSFQGSGWVSLGCIINNEEIKSVNEADSGVVTNLISGSDFSAIANSTKEHQIKLRMTRPYYTGGHGAPICYSHYRNFKVVGSNGIVVTSTIDQDNPATWPRFYFKELGFSVKLPFEKNQESRQGFMECRDGVAYDFGGSKLEDVSDVACNKDSRYASFFSHTKDDVGNIISFGSITKFFIADRDWTPNLMYNFHQVGDKFRYGDEGSNSFDINPLKVMYKQGRLIMIWDEVKDFYGKDERNLFFRDGAVYGIAIKLNGNKMFKAVAIEYSTIENKNMLSQVEEIAKSIKFN